jgi:uncharacterized protein (TIGR03437 family)
LDLRIALATGLLWAAPAFAQAAPQIGGGTCSAATLSGSYSVALNGQASLSDAIAAVGTAKFDGVGNITFVLTEASGAAVSAPQTLSGTYTLQTNCSGTLNLSLNPGGGTAAFALQTYSVGTGFFLNGSDANYTWTGSGSAMAASVCNAAMLSGTYTFAARGVTGSIHFDGKNAANLILFETGSASKTTADGAYIVPPSCIGSATVVDPSGGAWTLFFTAGGGTTLAVGGFGPGILFAGSGRAQSASGEATCSPATLTGVRSLVLTGAVGATLVGAGTATFDGTGKVMFSIGIDFTGAYTLGADCTGSVNLSGGVTASFNLIASANGADFTLLGQDAAYSYSGSGGSPPGKCITASFSGSYAFSGGGLSGILQFDGRGNLTANGSVQPGGGSVPDSLAGLYTVSSSCLGAGVLADESGNFFALGFVATSAQAADFAMTLAGTQTLVSISGHSTFNPPGMTLVNGASFASGATPPGSDFALFGTGIATGSAEAGSLPLPKKLLTTTLTVNGEAAPLYFVNASQINGQMPLDIQPGLATVTLTTNGAMSNSAAVTVPMTAVPGIFFYATDRGVFQNPGYALNSATAPAHPGDVEVAYFTGGGPVTPSGALTTGSASPGGLSPVVGTSRITVCGSPAVIDYIGLAPGLVGVYQADFVIPRVAAGDCSVVIGIGGTNSPAELITIGQ